MNLLQFNCQQKVEGKIVWKEVFSQLCSQICLTRTLEIWKAYGFLRSTSKINSHTVGPPHLPWQKHHVLVATKSARIGGVRGELLECSVQEIEPSHESGPTVGNRRCNTHALATRSWKQERQVIAERDLKGFSSNIELLLMFLLCQNQNMPQILLPTKK